MKILVTIACHQAGKLKIQLKAETPSNVASHSVTKFPILTSTEPAQVFSAFFAILLGYGEEFQSHICAQLTEWTCHHTFGDICHCPVPLKRISDWGTCRTFKFKFWKLQRLQNLKRWSRWPAKYRCVRLGEGKDEWNWLQEVLVWAI